MITFRWNHIILWNVGTFWEGWRVTFARLSWSFESSPTCLDARNTNKLPLIVNRFLRCKFLKILKCDQYTFWPNVSFKCRKKFNLGQRTPTNHRWRNLLDIYYYLTFFKNCLSVCLLFSLLFQIQWLFFYIFVLSSGYSSFT